MLSVTLEDAYKEACLALGEAIMRERLLLKQLDLQNNGSLTPVDPEPEANQ